MHANTPYLECIEMNRIFVDHLPFFSRTLTVGSTPDNGVTYIFGKPKADTPGRSNKGAAALFGLAIVVFSAMPQYACAEMLLQNDPGTNCGSVGDAYAWARGDGYSGCKVGYEAAKKLAKGTAFGNSLGQLSPGTNILVYGSTLRAGMNDEVTPLDSMNIGGHLDVWGASGFHGGVDMNNSAIKNLADGTLSATSTEAVTGRQLNATNTNITNLQNSIKSISSSASLVQQSAAGKDITVAKDLDGDAVDFSGKKLSDSTTFSRKLTGVAEGTLSATSTDAVSGKQLYATNQNVSKLSANVTDVSDSVTNIKNTMNTIVNGGGLKYFHANSTLDDAQAMGLESIAFGGAAVAAGMNSMAMGGNARAMAGNAVALGAGSVADRANTVSVGSAGKERQITNVAAGTADTDAVNVAQLKAAGIINGSGRTNATVTYGTNADGSADYGNVTLGGGNAPAGTAIHNVAAGTAETDAVNVRQMNAAIASVQKVSNTNDPMFAADGDRAVKRASAKGTHATAMGAAASAGGDQSVATGHNAQSGGDSSVAMGANAKATANHAVAVGSGSVANRANTMSVGSAGNERQITNVAAGVQGTDAVNVSQLSQAVYAAVGDLPAGTTARQYTDEQIGMVRQGINQVARGAYSGIAAATALTMIPDVDQGKSIAIGIGSATYKGYQAVALGASARISHNLKAKMGVGYSSEGTTVGMGASYQW
ncbi:YadA family autotransporter adhesin [Ralstonia pseudosolanacearum]|uniref:YadA family autotransporter adhesin n=2 Tax=Ralstonia pseudosolanacearum TaxID=1310165 RepID=UPI003D16984C